MKDNEETIWVELETHKGTPNISSYRGRMLLNDFNAWVSGELSKKCIKLSDAYWVEGEGWVDDPLPPDGPRLAPNYRVMGHDNGRQYSNHTGDIFFIAEHVVIIATLKDGIERDISLQKTSLAH